jgi:hypothetical protein
MKRPETAEAKTNSPKSDAHIRDPAKPVLSAHLILLLKVSESSKEIHWSLSQVMYLTAASLSCTGTKSRFLLLAMMSWIS